jgi:hypothetical protein
MSILGYNRYLVWVIVPAILWSMLAMSVIVAPGRRPPGDDQPGMGIRVKPGPDVQRFSGRLVRAEEQPGQLRIVLLAKQQQQRSPLVQPGLIVEYLEDSAQAPDEPEILLLQGRRGPQRLRKGSEVFATERFIVRYDRDSVEVMPRPEWLRPMGPREQGDEPRRKDNQRLERWLRERRGQSNPQGDARQGIGRRQERGGQDRPEGGPPDAPPAGAGQPEQPPGGR